MMVAVSIFVIVALVISGTYITLADVFRKVQSNRAIIDNLNFAMDTMTLQIREGRGHKFDPVDSCNDNCFKSITFDELVIKNGVQIPSRRITYKKGEGEEIARMIQCTTQLDDSGDPIPGGPSCDPITSPEITIKENGLRFYRKDSIPERIVIIIDGIAKNKKGLESEFTLQTTLAQRNF